MGAGFGTAGGAYRDGLFVLLSHRDSLLADAANPGQIAVMSVLVNEAGYGLIPYLRARYPHIAFVRGDEQQAFFERLTKESRA